MERVGCTQHDVGHDTLASSFAALVTLAAFKEDCILGLDGDYDVDISPSLTYLLEG